MLPFFAFKSQDHPEHHNHPVMEKEPLQASLTSAEGNFNNLIIDSRWQMIITIQLFPRLDLHVAHEVQIREIQSHHWYQPGVMVTAAHPLI